MNDRAQKLLSECMIIFTDIAELKRYSKGGQKIVFKGRHQEYGDIVLKLIEIEEKNARDRVLREINSTKILNSMFFAKVYEHDKITFELGNYIYIIEELIEGKNLRDILNEKGKLSYKQTLELGTSLLKSLNIVDDFKLVHRDLKPENIIINKDRVVLLDFGIVRDLTKDSLTSDFAMFGPMTPGYAAPEQINNQKGVICNRTDLFSWGVIMYECLAGVNPFMKGCCDAKEVVIKTLEYTPDKISCENEVFSDMVELCLNKTVHRRPKNSEYILKMISEEEV